MMELNNRVSVVGDLDVANVVYSSVVFVGDNAFITPKMRALAVRRDIPIFTSGEFKFKDYPLFTKPIPRPAKVDYVTMDTEHVSPYIQVGRVHIISLSTSSAFQAGSTWVIDCEARIKHFRQLVHKGAKPAPATLPVISVPLTSR